ncbi:MAG TPA: hypothetical protein VFX61_23490 [Micromonosporaceae bacterium]|nr:hypothetical protein [Micromonosporaceae bacterium]
MGRRTGDNGEPQQGFVLADGQPAAPTEIVYELGVVATETPPAPPPRFHRPQAWRRLKSTRVSIGALVLAVAAAAALGATVTNRWQAQQQRSAEESTVSLVVLTSNAHPTLGGRGTGWIRLEARLVVVNSGPLPIEIDTLYGRQDGLTLQGTESESVKPGSFRLLPVTIVVDCPARPSAKPVEVEMSVRTVDDRKHRHLSRVSISGINTNASYYCDERD